MHATFDLVLRVLWWWFLLVGHPWVSSSNSWGSAETSFINRSLAIAHQPYSPKPLILRPQMSRTIEPDPESNNPGRQSIYCVYVCVCIYIYMCVCDRYTYTHCIYVHTYIHACIYKHTYTVVCHLRMPLASTFSLVHRKSTAGSCNGWWRRDERCLRDRTL